MSRSRSTRRKILAAFLATASAGVLAAQAHAVSYSFSNGDRAGKAEFVISGSTLTLTLTNTYTGDTLDAAHLLNAVFFHVGDANGKLPGNVTPTFTKGTVKIAVGSDAYYYPTATQPVQPANDDVSGEWGFKGGVSNANVAGANFGLSSTGLGVFAPSDVFNTGLNLAGPLDPNGPQFGLLSAGDNAATGAPGNILNGGGLVKNAIVATLTNINFAEGDISTVWFKYGTGWDEPQFPGTNDDPPPPSPDPDPVPEPATLAMGLIGLSALTWTIRRR